MHFATDGVLVFFTVRWLQVKEYAREIAHHQGVDHI